mgnify:CR=1 FL=1
MIIVGYGGGTDSTAMLVGLWQRRIPVDLILFRTRRGAAPYLLVSSGHGSLAPDTWNAAHHPSMVSGLSWPAADTGAGVPAVKVAAVHRVWTQEVLTKVQNRALKDEVLQSLPSLPGNMEPR